MLHVLIRSAELKTDVELPNSNLHRPIGEQCREICCSGR